MALSRSQRIALIKEISTRLSQENWPLIDLTLREFELPTKDEWGGNADAYVMSMVHKAADAVLLELAQHCGFVIEEGIRPPGIDPPFWHGGMLRLFVSHLALHRDEAAQIQSAFLRCGVSCFVAHNDIEPSEEWLAQIETALATCDSLLALLHPKFHESQWTDQEVGFAMGRGVPFAVQDPAKALRIHRALPFAAMAKHRIARGKFSDPYEAQADAAKDGGSRGVMFEQAGLIKLRQGSRPISKGWRYGSPHSHPASWKPPRATRRLNTPSVCRNA